ncbi:MAG TPA: acyl carrier protein [Casimicrobiaceae bacterium]|jgi:acyl carrier protein|nr:acyl carrier protein [Casimicrobiaceae bacterium]
MNETFERVRALMIKEFQLDPTRVAPETPLSELGVDSLAALEFVFALENEFAIRFDTDVDLRGGAVRDVVAAVQTALSQHAAPNPAAA